MQRQMAESVPEAVFRMAPIKESPFQAVRWAIREVRAARNETQAQATEALECSIREYTNWEYSRNLPSFVLTTDILKREIETLGMGVALDVEKTLLGRMLSEVFGHDPEKFRYTLGRLATLVDQPAAPEEQ